MKYIYENDKLKNYEMRNCPDMSLDCDDVFLKLFNKTLTPPQYFHIQTFAQIGFHDPFPKEDIGSGVELPESHEDIIYCNCNFAGSPLLRYIPSRLMMFKIMRACIDVDEIEDLWYMQLMKKIKVSNNAKKKRAMMQKSTVLWDY